MHLSVIIVNYNVKYFLEQCLASVKRALEQGTIPQTGVSRLSPDKVEIIVVDNHSADGSIDYLLPRFPFVRFITNASNTGFAQANNQALAEAKGKYILFLNPDTILPENALLQCWQFMEDQPKAGALGVRMIDGSGTYLPESKRGFPSPWVSFCKMTGLTKLFPTSKTFARYYLGHLSPDNTHPVQVLSGAFMWIRKEILDKTGGFDERFFMYAEDIDLSYRIHQAGYQNYYLHSPVIIHFKGESTRRDARYVKLFYTAMIQFLDKHGKGISAWFYKRMLRLIIRLKSFGANAAPVKEDHTLAETPCFLKGDHASQLEMQPITRDAKRVLSETSSGANTILCQGENYSFQQLIADLASQPSNHTTYIHAQYTLSAVGSPYKKQKGDTIA